MNKLTNPPATGTPWAIRGFCLFWLALVVAAAYAFADTLGPRGRAVCGLAAFLLLVAACSSNLRRARLRVLIWGFILQFGLAWLILKSRIEPFTINLYLFQIESQGRPFYEFIQWIAGGIQTFLKFSDAGSEFVFGPLAQDEPMKKAFGSSFVFAFCALPPIICVSAFFTVLYHFGILQFIVRWLAPHGMMYFMGTSGAETFSAAANVFMGQTEAPLIVKPYVSRMTISELLALMVGGMATISGGVMAVYILLGADPVAILATSVMAAPCGLYLSKLMIPETEVPETSGTSDVPHEKLHRNAIDAASSGASDGMQLAINVAAMLIAFLAFIALFNHLLGLVNTAKLNEYGLNLPNKLSLEWLFGKLFSPIAFLMGVDLADTNAVGSLLGTKLVANEFVAYLQLTSPDVKSVISPRSFQLAVFALTGFANFSSIGIQIGGIGAMAPNRRADLAKLGMRALFVGFLATLVNAALAGILMD